MTSSIHAGGATRAAQAGKNVQFGGTFYRFSSPKRPLGHPLWAPQAPVCERDKGKDGPARPLCTRRAAAFVHGGTYFVSYDQSEGRTAPQR